MFRELVDIKEDSILYFDCELLNILLKDNSSKKNIIWATDIYEKNGYGYNRKDFITIEKVTRKNGQLIKPRIRKTKDEQNKRIKDKAEVFTPAWVCNKQNNQIDSRWFGKSEVFNKESKENWKTFKRKIKFNEGQDWKEYVSLLRLEISCGEAPYLVSRYDTVTGKTIDLIDRIGLLDRKFRIINENVDNHDEWIKWSLIALKSIYGYDWQGDNVLLARENILYTFADNYKYKFKKKPQVDLIKEVAEIISWNIFQMDGIKGVIPLSCNTEKKTQTNLFGEEDIIENDCIGCIKGLTHKHNGVYVRVKNWEKNKSIRFIDLNKGGNHNG